MAEALNPNVPPDTKKLYGLKKAGADDRDEAYSNWHRLYGQKLKKKYYAGKRYKQV